MGTPPKVAHNRPLRGAPILKPPALPGDTYCEERSDAAIALVQSEHSSLMPLCAAAKQVAFCLTSICGVTLKGKVSDTKKGVF